MLLWPVQAQQRACPPIFQAIKPAEQQTAGSFDRGQSIPVQPKGADPEWLPAANLSRASSEGGEANQGRCKCGEIPLPPYHPAAELTSAWRREQDTASLGSCTCGCFSPPAFWLQRCESLVIKARTRAPAMP